MTAVCVMVLGTSSGAGKSWIATALCRHYARQGLKVAPFKSQNMSNNARVVAGPGGAWGEIGSAQYFQALAARATPQVRMNPVLLKPETDRRSQVVVMGEPRPELLEVGWRERSALLWRTAAEALESLRDEFDLVVLEGAGSPAEINLAASDYVNTRSALAAAAACLLVADIDRGGAFAHLYGTHALMDERLRPQVRGFVLNRFRGDAGLLAPGPEELERLTGVPTVAVVPMLREHGLPEEDEVPRAGANDDGPRVVVVCAPHASNLDEFEPLRAAPVALSFSRDAREIAGADWLVLPGSKHTRADLAWLRANGVDAAIRAHAAAGKPLLAICGGMQIAGVAIDDPHGIEGGAAGGDAGLALLPLATRFEPAKRLARARYRFAALRGAWAPLSGIEIDGYEIRQGRSRRVELPSGAGDDAAVAATACDATLAPDDPATPVALQRGSVLGLYPHGLFENPGVVRALFGAHGDPLEQAFERLADQVDESFAPGFLMSLLEKT